MKSCYYCGAKIEDDADFCTECGNELPDCTCPQCGADVRDGDNFCQNCGYDLINDVGVEVEDNDDSSINPSEYEEISPKSKKLLPIIIGLLVLVLIGGGWYFYNSNKFPVQQETTPRDSISETVDKSSTTVEDEISDVHSEEYIKHRLQQICNEVPSTSVATIINSFFSDSFKQRYKAVCSKYGSEDNDGMGFFGLYFWSGGGVQDNEIQSINALKVENKTDLSALATVQDVIINENEEYKRTKQVKLVFENGDWFIDDINNHKSGMTEYLNEDTMQEEQEEQETSIDNEDITVEDE